MAAPAPPQSGPGNGWASPFGAATHMQPFDDEDRAMRRSGNANGPPTMHQRRPSDPSVSGDFSGFTLLTRRSKSVTLPGSAAGSREASQHEAMFASTVSDVRKEDSSPTAAGGGRTWNPFRRKANAGKKAAAEDPPAKSATLPAAVVGSENSGSSRRWGRSKAPVPAAAAAPAAAATALNIDVRDAEPGLQAAGAGSGSPPAGSERPASAPAAVKAAAGQPHQSVGTVTEVPVEGASANGGGANSNARWFGKSPSKPGAQPPAALAPRTADAVLKTGAAAAKPEAGVPGPGSGRFGALFSGIQRSSMSKPAAGKGKGKAGGDEPPTAGRDSGEAAAGAGL